MNKADRQEKLLQIVTTTEVDTQEELIKILKLKGLEVTQATVSRDVKELGLVKIAGKSKKYRYARGAEKQIDSQRLLFHLKAAVLKVDCAQNLVVVKTLVGNGSAVAAVLDAEDIPEIVGTLAGDDTVLIVTKDFASAQNAAFRIKNLCS